MTFVLKKKLKFVEIITSERVKKRQNKKSRSPKIFFWLQNLSSLDIFLITLTQC